jgi:microcystin-dependent protein
MGGSSASRLTNTVLSASNALGATGGSQTHTLTSGQSGLPSHLHTINHDHAAFTSGNDSPDHAHSTTLQITNIGGYGQNSPIQGNAVGNVETRNTGGASVRHQHNIDVPNFTGNSGSVTAANASEAHTNTQPTIVLNYIIKA